jgi:hypothetical protein
MRKIIYLHTFEKRVQGIISMEKKVVKPFKNYFLKKLVHTRLFFIRKNTTLLNFIDRIKAVKKVLIILPINKHEEQMARTYLEKFSAIFTSCQISTLDVTSLRKSDVNWLGVPNTSYLRNIQSEDFDLIIDLNGSHNYICAYLGALTRAPMRLHIAEGIFDKIYNIQIRSEPGDSLERCYDRVLHYLELMRQ